MSKRVALSVSLTAELAAFVAAKVGSGRYGSASEVVRMGLRLLEEKDRIPPRHQTKGKTKVRKVPDES
ncbi:MAG: type II toxin-antitoxin system ParD family antitoxin [Janthinobacterium lividum]